MSTATDYRPALPEHVAKLYPIEEDGPLLRFDRDQLPDLDDLLLFLASIDRYGEPREWNDLWRDISDRPTHLDWWWRQNDRELRVGCFRIVPCSPMSCGEHCWHVHPVKGALDWRQPPLWRVPGGVGVTGQPWCGDIGEGQREWDYRAYTIAYTIRRLIEVVPA